MNSIGKISFQFKGDNQEFFQSLYASWDSFFTLNIERPTDDVLMFYDNEAEQLEIESLELDLGILPEENFTQHFAAVYREKLEETLQLYLNNETIYNVKRASAQKKLSELLCHFLLHGSLPWDINSKYKDINFLFLEVVRHEGVLLKKFLLTYGHYTALQRRLVFQLGDTSLEEGVRLIAAAESTFITSYVYFLQSKYKVIRKPAITRSGHRDVVWQVVYAYLLNNKSSYFNKKSFLKYTISSLAKRHNQEYTYLLEIIAGELEQHYAYNNIKSGLYSILRQLKKEMPEQQLQGPIVRVAKIYKDLTLKALQNKHKWKTNRQVLVEILKKEDSCRMFLQHLTEPEIIGLVKILLPQEHDFVISYAKSLDRHKEKGLLQGRAGGEFRLLKWQIILPILLDTNRAGFNHKYFVLRTLQKVAAHYNIKIKELLEYFLTSDKERTALTKNIIRIFEIIYRELANNPELPQNSQPLREDEQWFMLQIQSGVVPEADELQNWKRLLRNTTFREKVLDKLQFEKEHIAFIRLLFPVHAPLITAYAKSLDMYRDKKSLEGKTGGRFSQLKWKFIHAVLFEPQQQVFNKKYFVSRVILRIAAHYNLQAKELINFFYSEIAQQGMALPFELIKVLKELYNEQADTQVAKAGQAGIGSTSPQKKASEILYYYFGKDPALSFIIENLAANHEFVVFIEEVLRADLMLRKLIRQELGIDPDTKTVLKILLRFSASYQQLSGTVILGRLLLYYSILVKSKEVIKFEEKLRRLGQSSPSISETLKQLAENDAISNEVPENILEKDGHIKNNEIQPEAEMIKDYINNAGLVILHPYLPRLFGMLLLTEDGKFKNEDSQIRAMFLMQYAVFGKTEFPEHQMQLNKLLAGLKPGSPVPQSVELTTHEKETVEGLLTAVIQNWSKLGTTSVEGLRGTFLIRDGKLDEQDDFYQLTVEEKAFDILLGSLPWSISTIKYSWMEKGINVKWR